MNAKELLQQYYLTAKDLTVIVPKMHIYEARKLINEVRDEMKEKKMYVPQSKEKQALTKLIIKKLGI